MASPPLPLVGTERDAAQLEPVAVMQPGTLGEYTAKPAGRGRMRVAVHPLVLGVVAPDHPMPWLEARQLHVLRVGAADGDDVCLERELPLDAGRFRLPTAAWPSVAMTRRGFPARTDVLS